MILQLGNNGPVTAGQFDEIMDVLAGAQRVVVINVKVPRPWEAPNNEMMAAGVKRWPNAVLMDWHKHGTAHPELFGDDGTHMGPTGRPGLRGAGARSALGALASEVRHG